MSKLSSSRFPTGLRPRLPASSLSLSAAFEEQLSALYNLVQRSSHVFASPLGPFPCRTQHFHLPRFSYFGPEVSDASVRLAFFAGFDHRELRSTLALLHFVEGLALAPDLGPRLNLSIFPLVDVLGLAGLVRDRPLAAKSWVDTTAPELLLLEKDTRRNGYHGFVRLETAAGDDVITARLRGSPHVENPTPGVELINSEDFEPFAVRWETASPDEPVTGPLTVAADLPFQPFELTLRLPATWPPELHCKVTASILKRFVLRYRGFIAYGQHL